VTYIPMTKEEAEQVRALAKATMPDVWAALVAAGDQYVAGDEQAFLRWMDAYCDLSKP
jgi:hypothetical protein